MEHTSLRPHNRLGVSQVDSAETIERVPIHYLRHKPEVDVYLKDRDSLAEQVREEVERRFPSTGIRERLLARRK
jgi:hypothetical protein